jgi:hypothetical protein
VMLISEMVKRILKSILGLSHQTVNSSGLDTVLTAITGFIKDVI